MTAKALPRDRRRFAAMGVAGVIIKPFNSKQVWKQVAESQTPPQGGSELLIATDEWQGIRLILPKRIQRFFDKMCIWLAERNLMKIERVAVNPGMVLVAQAQIYIHQVQPPQEGDLRSAAILILASARKSR